MGSLGLPGVLESKRGGKVMGKGMTGTKTELNPRSS